MFSIKCSKKRGTHGQWSGGRRSGRVGGPRPAPPPAGGGTAGGTQSTPYKIYII